jgi:hypothetical protein
VTAFPVVDLSEEEPIHAVVRFSNSQAALFAAVVHASPGTSPAAVLRVAQQFERHLREGQSA